MYDVLENSEGIVLEGCDITTDDELLTSDGWQRVQELRVRTFMVGFTLYPNNVFYVVRRAMDALADKDQAGEGNTKRDTGDSDRHDLSDEDRVVRIGHSETVDDAETPVHVLNEVPTWEANHRVRTCRECGCTDEDGCQIDSIMNGAGELVRVITCSWVKPDLCSECRDIDPF
jgi:hypothetical protein